MPWFKLTPTNVRRPIIPVALSPTPESASASAAPVNASGACNNRMSGTRQPPNCKARMPNVRHKATMTATPMASAVCTNSRYKPPNAMR